MEYLTFLKILHLTGLVAGFGGALYADFLMVTGGVLTPLSEKTLQEVERISHIVIYGLLLLWGSGIALAFELLSTNPHFMLNEKFWAKVVIVIALTINGFFVHYVVLKQAKKSLNTRLLLDSSLPVLILLTLSGSLSFISWTTPFILGKTPEFSYVVPFEVILTLWGLAILASVAGVLMLVAMQEMWENYQRSRRAIVPRLGGWAF